MSSIILPHWVKSRPLTAFHEDELLPVMCGFITYLIFKRWEPHRISVLSVPLLILPLGLSMALSPHCSFYSITVTFTLYYTSFVGSLIGYRLGPWHPLAQYPGPAWMKISMLGQLLLALKFSRHKYILYLHEHHKSDIVRIGPNEISIRDASAIVPIMGTNGLPKGPSYDARALHEKDRSLTTWTDNTLHVKRRRPWNRGLGTTSLKSYEPAMVKRVAQLGKRLMQHAENGTAVDLSQCVKFFSYDFMGDMAFGGGTDLLRDGDKHHIFQSMRDGIRAAMILDAFPWIAHYVKWIPSVTAKFQEIRTSSIARVKSRILKGTMTKDLFYYLSNEDEVDPVTPTLDAVAREGILAIFAGSDTTAYVISSTILCLLKHPETYVRLREEVDKFYPPGEDALHCDHHSQMPFLEAVINETLRLYPAQPGGSQRKTMSQGLQIGPHYIPPHTNIRIHTYSIHRDPRNFSPYPESFYPDRWLIAEKPSLTHKSSLTHNPNAHIPFSFGPANCVGKGLALKEIRMVLCFLMQQFEMKLAEGYDGHLWDGDIRDWIATQFGKLPLTVSRRG